MRDDNSPHRTLAILSFTILQGPHEFLLYEPRHFVMILFPTNTPSTKRWTNWSKSPHTFHLFLFNILSAKDYPKFCNCVWTPKLNPEVRNHGPWIIDLNNPLPTTSPPRHPNKSFQHPPPPSHRFLLASVILLSHNGGQYIAKQTIWNKNLKFKTASLTILPRVLFWFHIEFVFSMDKVMEAHWKEWE